MKEQEQGREMHYLVGNGISPDGVMKGCAHSGAELRAYIAFGTLPNTQCPSIARWNKESVEAAAANETREDRDDGKK